MSVVDQAVKDGIGQGRVADGCVAMFDEQLAGNDGRARTVSVVEYLQQVAPVYVGAPQGWDGAACATRAAIFC